MFSVGGRTKKVYQPCNRLYSAVGRVRAYGELLSRPSVFSNVRRGCPLSLFLSYFIVDILLENFLN